MIDNFFESGNSKVRNFLSARIFFAAFFVFLCFHRGIYDSKFKTMLAISCKKQAKLALDRKTLNEIPLEDPRGSIQTVPGYSTSSLHCESATTNAYCIAWEWAKNSRRHVSLHVRFSVYFYGVYLWLRVEFYSTNVPVNTARSKS